MTRSAARKPATKKAPTRKTAAKKKPASRKAAPKKTTKAAVAKLLAGDAYKVLHVGCGSKDKTFLPAPFQSEAWREIRYDINPACKPHIIGDMTDMTLLPDGSVDAIFSSHNIEHLYAHQVPRALGEFLRVLKPESGLLILTCPDLQSLGEQIAAGKILEPLYKSPAGPITALDILYGHRASIARGDEHMAHKVGFTNRVLVDTLKSAGFNASTGVRYRRSFDLWALGFCWNADREEMSAYAKAMFPAA